MEANLHISSSPHIRSDISTSRIMLDVIISLLPAAIAGIIIFGLRALAVIAVAVLVSVISEFIFNKILKKDNTLCDCSAIVTGLILALNLPANIPLWQVAIGAIFAIIVVKCIFGGIGCNIVNPAATARVFMTIAFSASIAKTAFPGNIDAISGATPLVEIAEGKAPDILDLFIGNVGGAIGEACTLAILIGGAYLLIRRVITWHIPVVYIAAVFVLSLILKGLDFSVALSLILSGGLFFGAFFMATDYVTSPPTKLGKVIFGLGLGLITILIRFYGEYPEGVSFAILLMNILNPYVCSWTPRKLFGGDK